MQTTTDVLVVGGGPTGLMMATQLARYGVGIRIVDEQAERVHESRAFGLQARSLEMFDQLGLGEEFASRARRADPIVAHVRGKRIAEVRFDPLVGITRYPGLYLLPQNDTERILLDDLSARGIAVERPLRLLSFVQDPDGITAELEHVDSRARETIRCRYLVGCDGAHSRVREILEIPFEGATYPADFILADVDFASDVPLAFYFTRHAICLVASLGSHTRIMGVLLDKPSLTADAPATIDDINTLARAARAPIQIDRALWTSHFRLHHRATQRYRLGRAFLAGDACHIHTPMGGQGMNTGFGDATNLAWKLAFVLRGASPDLLDTYERERQRVGEILVRTTDRAFGLATSRRFGTGVLRELVASLVFQAVARSYRLRSRLVRFVSELDIRYHASYAVREVTDGADPMFHTALHAGCRVPDLDLEGIPLHDLLRGTAVHILAFGACNESELRDVEHRHAGRVIVHRVQASASAAKVFQRFGVSQAAIYVVRPDGYVGFRSFGPSVRAAADYLNRIAGPPLWAETPSERTPTLRVM